MRIGIFGATGVIGQRILAEADRRGHQVTAFSRNPAADPRHRRADVLDPGDAIDGLDVVVNAINSGSDPEAAIANARLFPAAATALLKALERRPATRLVVVGGAGSLEVSPGLQLVDADGFAESLPAQLGMPAEYVEVVLAHREALNRYRLSNRQWTYLSPSSGLIRPGERTGRYRLGGDQLLDVTADISAEDLAVAVLDEIELPRHLQRRFTVGSAA
ncbi:NAD(P)H-binding protein [Saccharothrix sp. AJ9571]|nr:NAD(P)H-binding protein [Saccharothrix sp. AJ9571]